MSRKIKVVHCKKEIFDVYIGRPSKFGNPFIIGTDGTRDEVIEKFKQYILRHPKLLAIAKEELKGKKLGCWCAPDRCHGDIYKQLIEEEHG